MKNTDTQTQPSNPPFTQEQQAAWSRANGHFLYAVGKSQAAADRALEELHRLEYQQDMERSMI